MAYNQLSFSSDAPEEFIENDILGVSPFVDSLYDLLNRINPDHGFVISLNGEWGSGKSTIINFLKEKKLKDGNECTFSIIDFSPWNIIDKQSLLKNFFIVLKNTIYNESKNSKIKRLIQKYYLAIIEGIKIIPKVNIFSNIIENFIQPLFNTNEESITDIKNQISNYLNTIYNGKNIVIIIDDLDRLTDEELCIVLKLIKEIADFPKLIYLLSMDKQHVINAINNFYQYNDELKSQIYLEKFIQLDWNLPVPNHKIIEEKCLNNIKKCIDDNIIVSEGKYLRTIFNHLLKDKISTPRNMKLLINQYTATYPNFKEYVNCADYLIILYLQLFNSDLYNFIKNNKKFFTNSFDEPHQNIEKYKKMIDDFLEKRQNADYIVKLFDIIFPEWRVNYGTPYFVNNEKGFIKNMVRHQYCFDNYFGKIDRTQKTTKELQNLVKSCDVDKILFYFSSTQSMSNKNLLPKIKTLIFIWEELEKNENQLYAILFAILRLFNINNYNNEWIDFIKNYVFKEINQKVLEQVIYKIIKENEVTEIYNSFIFLIEKIQNPFEQSLISDQMCASILECYINKLLKEKTVIKDINSPTIIELLIENNKIDLVKSYIAKYKKSCVYVILHIFTYPKPRQILLPKLDGSVTFKNSHDFWVNIKNPDFLFMIDYDQEIYNIVKNQEYSDIDYPEIKTIDSILKKYLKIINKQI